MSRILRGGYASTYGHTLGIISSCFTCPRIPGDVGNATTFDFPVKYKVLKGIGGSTIVRKLDSTLLKPFIDAAQELEREGAKAITSSCGFLALFQNEVANSVKIPVFMSSLVQVPLVYRMLGSHQKVGIITIDSRHLTERHFTAVGAESIPKVVVGTENEDYFCNTLLANEPDLDVDRATKDLVAASKKLVSKDPDVGAVVLECVNMPPYAKAVQDAVNLPVFDIITLSNMVYSAIRQSEYIGHM